MEREGDVPEIDSVAMCSLDARITAMERVLGRPKFSQTVEGDLLAVNKQLDRLTNSEKFKAALQMYQSVNKSTDQSQIEAGMPLGSKIEAVLACYDNLSQKADYLNEMASLDQYINPTSFRDISKFTTKLEPIQQVHLQQQEAAATLGKDLDECLAQYNQL
eukprot:Ihof_evm7s105 gene=Ihof_evmTU7s105